MAKKVLVILGHPSKQSFNNALAEAYAEGAKKAGAEVQKLAISDLKFDPILHDGYNRIQELEPDLKKAQELIRWAEHIVWVYPTWWASMPALMKGFIDRIFLPGFAFNFRKGSPLWDKHLKGRTSHLIVTMGGPPLYYRFALFSPGIRMMDKGTLGFCGIKVKCRTIIGRIRKLPREKVDEYCAIIRKKGEKLL